MDKNYQVGRMIDMKDLSYVYGLLTDYRNRHSRYFFREYNDVFTFENFSQYWEFNTEKEGLFELMYTLRSNNSLKKEESTVFKSEICTKFLPSANAFHSKWGGNMVPIKLRLLISAMHQLVGRDSIMWPAMLIEVDTDMIFFASETDQYGRPLNGSTVIDASSDEMQEINASRSSGHESIPEHVWIKRHRP